MPYPMSHLYTARKILDSCIIRINDLPQYYLGTLGPDAIHFREDFNIIQKRTTHLYVGLERENLDIFIKNWFENVVKFYNSYKLDKNHDFLLGYCIHLIGDIYNYQFIWTPFKNEFGRDNNIYQNECKKIDLEMYCKENAETCFFPLIKQSKSIDFFDLIPKKELDDIKNNILNVQYKQYETVENGESKFITYDKMKGYNNDMSEYIKKEFIELIG